MNDRLEKMTTKELQDLEFYLYELECNGVNTWFKRDKILNELNSREKEED